VEDIDVCTYRPGDLLGEKIDVCVVVAEEYCVLPVGRSETAQSSIVGGIDVVPLRIAIDVAKHFRCTGAVEAAAVESSTLRVDVLEAVTGVEVPSVVEEMVAGVGEGCLVALEFLPSRFAKEGADGNDAIGVGAVEGTVGRQELAPANNKIIKAYIKDR